MEGLTAFETAVLDKLLAGDHPVLTALRSQATRGRLASREYTGVGFFLDFQFSPDAPVLSDRQDFHLGGVSATIGGLQHGAGFVLFVRGGRLTTLEGYSYDEPWPETLRHFELSYTGEPRTLPLPVP